MFFQIIQEYHLQVYLKITSLLSSQNVIIKVVVFLFVIFIRVKIMNYTDRSIYIHHYVISRMLSSISKTYKFTGKESSGNFNSVYCFCIINLCVRITGEYLVENFLQNLHEKFTANIKLDFENKFFECFYDYFLVQFYWKEK